MRKLMIYTFCMLLFLVGLPFAANAATEGTANMIKAEQLIQHALQAAQAGKLSDAKAVYDEFNDQWLDFEDTVKADSGTAYKDIEANMGQVSYAFLQNKQPEVIKALKGLLKIAQNYVKGQYASGDTFKEQNISLSDFITMLQRTKESIQNHDKQSSLKNIEEVREAWLSVEGTVVAQSAKVYSDSERDMVTVNAMITSGNDQGAVQLLDKMIGYLSPLSTKSGYTIWDAAMIPIREGLEALLVVGALLAFVKKSNNSAGRGWIWGGIWAGLIVSAILAVIVKVVFSSGAFGQNNFLITGWTGILAAAMLLYMSYWLHSKSNIAEWNRYIREKSQSAIDTGRIISLGVLSFLAVFREGTETVLFLVGMVNQISTQSLIAGILIGIGVLVVIAILMLYIGVKLPIRAFFLVSSVIVFYLCFKFTGMGIHSLQLAGLLPSSMAEPLPSIDFLGFYPSWQSAVPQILLILLAAAVLFWKQFARNQQA